MVSSLVPPSIIIVLSLMSLDVALEIVILITSKPAPPLTVRLLLERSELVPPAKVRLMVSLPLSPLIKMVLEMIELLATCY